MAILVAPHDILKRVRLPSRALVLISCCTFEHQMLSIRDRVCDCHPSCVTYEFAHVCQERMNDSLSLHACVSIGSSRVAFELRLLIHGVKLVGGRPLYVCDTPSKT